MTRTLITGMSGVGKSTVVAGLRERGIQCIDMDEPGWSFEDGDGHQRWNVEGLQAAMDVAGGAPLVVSGCAEDQVVLYPHFDAIVLLSLPREIMLERIRNRDGNDFGKSPIEQTRILDDLSQVEPRLRERCTHEIVTTMPLAEVVERVVGIIRP